MNALWVSGLLSILLIPFSVNAYMTCSGKFVNPITDICWKCLFPLSIAGRNVANPNQDNATPDEDKSFVCLCGNPVPRIGIPVGFWEPFRLADVTYKPFCMVNLGGIDLKLNLGASAGTVSVKQGGETARKTAFYHVHWYIYPVLYWMNLVVNLACMTSESFDVAYMTELDPLWNDDEISIWLNPEVALFANPIAQMACAADCVKSSVSTPINTLFWCAGCQGGVYPLTGTLGFHNGGADASTLMVEKLIFKLHREMLLWGSMGKKAACSLYPMPWWRKDQYKLQMTYPSVTRDPKKLATLSVEPLSFGEQIKNILSKAKTLDILSGDGETAVFYKRLFLGALMILFSVPGYSNKPDDSDLLIFVSFSMPKESLKLWAEQASRIGCPLLLRGFVDNDLTKTTAKMHAMFGEKANIEILIDPEKFQKFNIDVVPAVVLVDLAQKDANDDSVPYFDVVYGDTSLEEALNRIAKSESLANQKTATHYLKKYRDSHE